MNFTRKAYGLYLGCSRAPIKRPAVLDRGSKHRTGATVSSRMAPSRCASAGELLAWRPSVWDTRALMGVNRGVRPGLWQGSAACNRTMRILTRSEDRRYQYNAKMAL